MIYQSRKDLRYAFLGIRTYSRPDHGGQPSQTTERPGKSAIQTLFIAPSAIHLKPDSFKYRLHNLLAIRISAPRTLCGGKIVFTFASTVCLVDGGIIAHPAVFVKGKREFFRGNLRISPSFTADRVFRESLLRALRQVPPQRERSHPLRRERHR